MTLTKPNSLWWARITVGLAGILLVSGCVNTDPPLDTAAGSYTATTFLTTTGGQTTDHIAAGSTISIVLNPQRTTSGHLHVVAVGGAEGLDADLTGTWTIANTTVDLSHPADTFLRDMLFEFDDGTLVGDDTFDDTRFQITLTRAD